MSDMGDRELLIRIDERVQGIEKQLTMQYATKGDLGALDGRVKLLERIVFGMIGVIMLGVLGAIGSLVMKGAQ